MNEFPIGIVITNDDRNKIDVESEYDSKCRLFRVNVKLKNEKKEVKEKEK